MPRTATHLLAFSALAACVISTGCVRRTISISSEPEGALVYLNDREIGRTPVEVEFVHYGTYDVRLVKDGYEPLLTFGKARPPMWDVMGVDLLAEAVPGEPHSRIAWHYVMERADNDPTALTDRARDLRQQIEQADPAP